jgi:hypothetical protein
MFFGQFSDGFVLFVPSYSAVSLETSPLLSADIVIWTLYQLNICQLYVN